MQLIGGRITAIEEFRCESVTNRAVLTLLAAPIRRPTLGAAD